MPTTDNLKEAEIWLLTGSQDLYGKETLDQVEVNAREIASHLNKHIPFRFVHKVVLKSGDEIYEACAQANTSDKCIGVCVWAHTFSPAKMWIRGLKILHKPIMHLHTQFNRDIPWGNIDMNYMNLHQSAHGDRELAHIIQRMQIRCKTVVGHWKEAEVSESIESFGRAAYAWADWQGAKFIRFGDNMRNVAVTEGDKVEAEIKFGFSVNTYGIGDVVKVIDAVPQKEASTLVEDYARTYSVRTDKTEQLLHAARIEIGIQKFLEAVGAKGFTFTFEDLHGMQQLPGMAAQRLMHKGYGFAGEGDWKTTALLRAFKMMAEGCKGGNSFMEDYTYHFQPEQEMVLGAHMLELCPSIAKGPVNLEVHPLAIGGKADPARLVFNAGSGLARNTSLVDMGDHFRLIVNEVEAVEIANPLPSLPVARALWKPFPNMRKGLQRWLEAGGAHHTVYSQNVSYNTIEDFARIANIETVYIN